MEYGREPDIIKNSLQPSEEEFGPNLIRLRVTHQIRELQTVLRDKCVFSCMAVKSKIGIIHTARLAIASCVYTLAG